ncbi:hypothetical protein [Actinomadura rubrisoli]|nr:hypothetical protein [Actinomadura rubrisoli]
MSMMITLILGVAASSAGTRAVARAAWVSGLVNAVVICGFISGPGEDVDVRYGAGYGQLIAFVFVVVFFCVAHTASDERPTGRDAQWLEPSFGTVDRRTHVKGDRPSRRR